MLAAAFAVSREARQAIASIEPAIDLVHLARQTDGDAALEAELVNLFDRQCADHSARLARADLPPLARAEIAHRLKGSALAIGAARVAAAAAALEAAFEAGGLGDHEPTRAIHELVDAVDEARAAIASLRG